MKLTKTFTSEREIQGSAIYNGIETRIEFVAEWNDYDGANDIRVYVSEIKFWRKGATTAYTLEDTKPIEITGALENGFLMDNMLETIDWEEIYYETCR